MIRTALFKITQTLRLGSATFDSQTSAPAIKHGTDQVAGPRHVRASDVSPPLYKPCEISSCVVTTSGVTSDCNERACPSCGTGGSTFKLLQTRVASLYLCKTCQRTWPAEGEE